MRFKAVFGMAVFLASPASGQTDFDAQARVTEALAAVRPIAMNSSKVDWSAVETQARAIAAEARDTVDLLPAYHLITWSLHDEHSFMQPPEPIFQAWLTRTNSRRYLPDTPRPRQSVSAFKRRPVSGRDLTLPGDHSARLVVVPANTGGTLPDALAQSIVDQVVATPTTCGYVVDLRGNTGGNMGPMLDGLAPLLGDGFVVPMVAGPGQEEASSKIENGETHGYLTPDATDFIVLSTLPKWPDRPRAAGAPVAVLLDQATASSGEAVAVALKGRANTRFFGERTFGVASANQDVPLSDGITLFVTVALLRDANGVKYPQGVSPDEAVATGPGDRRDRDDAVEEAAKAWLAHQSPCMA